MIKELTMEKTSLPAGWEIKTLGEVCEIFNGSTPLKSKREFWDDGEINWFTISDIRKQGRNIKYTQQKITSEGFNSTSITLLPKKSVLLCCTASVGEYAITDVELTTNQQFNGLVVKEKNKLFSEYLFHYSSTLKEKLLSKSGKATIDFVSMTKVKTIPIPLPPLPQQKQIVAILDQAFAAIDTAKVNAEQNLQNAKELFESYLQNIFENKGDDWEEKTLGVVCNKIQDGAHHSPKTLYPNREEGLYPYVTSKNVRNNYMDLTKLQFVDEAFHKTIYPRCKPEIGDVLLTKDGAKTGNVTLNTLDEPFSLLSSVCLIKTNKNELRADFLKYYIQSPIGFKSITGKMTGAAIKRIILRAIKSATIPLPLVDEQKEIVKNIDSLLTETKKIEAIYTQKIADLEEMKKSVLQKAFSGQLNTIN